MSMLLIQVKTAEEVQIEAKTSSNLIELIRMQSKKKQNPLHRELHNFEIKFSSADLFSTSESLN